MAEYTFPNNWSSYTAALHLFSLRPNLTLLQLNIMLASGGHKMTLRSTEYIIQTLLQDRRIKKAYELRAWQTTQFIPPNVNPNLVDWT